MLHKFEFPLPRLSKAGLGSKLVMMMMMMVMTMMTTTTMMAMGMMTMTMTMIVTKHTRGCWLLGGSRPPLFCNILLPYFTRLMIIMMIIMMIMMIISTNSWLSWSVWWLFQPTQLMIIIMGMMITLPNSTHDHIDDDNANENEHWWR